VLKDDRYCFRKENLIPEIAKAMVGDHKSYFRRDLPAVLSG
jgi:hypothetical protein